MTKSIFLLALMVTIPMVEASAVAATAPTAPMNLRVPAMAFDDTSIILVWDKPETYADVVDYEVTMNGKKLGRANANNAQHSPAKKYIDGFYALDVEKFHVRIQIHNFTVTDLKPNTKYQFTVRAILKDGTESPASNTQTQKTLPAMKVISIAAEGAKGDGQTVNTKAIQAAIDACPKHGKVLVPKGVWKTGALFLKSAMTLEIAEGATLLGSEDANDYPLSRGYRLYPYSKNDRPPSLINLLAHGKHKPGAFQNVRIVGKGTINGNGWKKAAKPSIVDEIGEELPVYVASNNKKVMDDGILAKSQFNKSIEEGLDAKTAYGQRRSSLILIRGARNVFIGQLTVLNPAFHGIMALESDTVTVAGVTHKTYDASNADGVELGNSNNGIIFNNFFDTGDDGMNFAAGTGIESAKQAPQQNTWIFNNYFRKGHGAVVIGSHTGAWIQNILAEDNVAVGTDVGLRCKSTVANGGGGRDIIFRDNALKAMVKQAFIFTLEYNDANAANDYLPAKIPGKFYNITVKNVTVDGVQGKDGVLVVKGDTERQAFHEKLLFENVALKNTPPASISDLRQSVFKDMTWNKMVGGPKPFTIKNSEGLRFEGKTPKP